MMCEPLVDRKCACCGRTFIPAPYHIYKKTYSGHVVYFCSYTCYNKGATKKNIRRENHNGGRPKRAVLQYTKDGEFIKEYPSIKDAVLETGIAESTIYNGCRGVAKPYKFIFKFKDQIKERSNYERTDETDTERENT